MKTKITFLAAAIKTTMLSAMASVPLQAMAQDNLDAGDFSIEEIVVTARKRSESLTEIPLSVSALTADMIEQTKIEGLNDIADYTLGFSMNSAFGRQGDRPVVRGVSSIFTSTELAGFFVDGVYISGSLQSFDLEAVERVEVIKGPQSAVFGRRTFSGAINYITKKPTDEFEGKIKAEVGSNGHRILSTSISGAGTDIIGYRISARTYEYDGDFENVQTGGTGGPDVGGEETHSINGSLYITPTESTEIRLNLAYSEDDDEHYAVYLQGSSFNNCNTSLPYYCGTLRTDLDVNLGGILDPDDYGIERDRLRGFAQISHEFDNGLELLWTSSFTKLDTRTGQDQSFGGKLEAFSFSSFSITPEAAQDWHTLDEGETDDISHEIRLSGSAVDDRLGWSVGGYYFDSESDSKDLIEGDSGEDEITNIAFMSSINYEFNEQFRASFEVRYAEDEITEISKDEMGVEELKNNETFDSVTHRLTFSYFPIEDTMLYLNWATGVLPGGFNSNSDLPNALIPIDEQEMDQYEIGAKTTINGNLQIIAALYRMDWSKQVRSEFFIPAGGGAPIGYQANQGESQIDGIELEVIWAANEYLSFSVGASWQESEIKEFISQDRTDIAITDGGDVSGNQLPLSPEWEGFVSAMYEQPLSAEWEMRTRLDAFYQDTRYVRTVNLAETGDETRINANVAFIYDDKLELSLWGKNLTDEDAAVSGLRYIEADSEFFGGRAFVVTPQRPREYGVTATYRF